FARFDLAVYARKVFSMFGGTEELVRLRFVNELIGVIIDRFGKEVSVMKDDDSHFVIAVNVAISPQFFGWLSSFGTNAKILSPQSVAEDFRRHISAILNS
ncbi:MAG: WYL domain-containing protein, partial [Clostridia bacterium]